MTPRLGIDLGGTKIEGILLEGNEIVEVFRTSTPKDDYPGTIDAIIHVVAELDIDPSLWFFDCPFRNDPVMPGCLGLAAMWQLVGYYLAWIGGVGRGRALGVGEVKFQGQVLPDSKLVTYRLDMKRVIKRKLVMGLGDAEMDVDGRTIYQATNLRVGLFTSTEGF